VLVSISAIFKVLEFFEQKALQVGDLCLFLMNELFHDSDLLLIIIMFIIEGGYDKASILSQVISISLREWLQLY
jgi:hypothetical protein